MKINEKIYVKTREEWREWLENNHHCQEGIWLGYYKKHTGKPRIPYEDAVEEALCFGWIDSTVMRIDEKTYIQKFTPRRKRSVWSKLNKMRALKMIKSARMTSYGMEKIEEAKNTGRWQEAYTTRKKTEMPEDLKDALDLNKIAKSFFNSLSASNKNRYVNWVNFARRKETRSNRIAKVVEYCSGRIKPGMM